MEPAEVFVVTLNPPRAETEFNRREHGGTDTDERVEDFLTALGDGAVDPRPKAVRLGEGVTEETGFDVGTTGPYARGLLCD